MRRRLALLLLLALVASACQIRTDVHIEINADETGTLAFELGFDEEFRQLAESEGGDLSFDGFDELATNTPAGWGVTDFDDGEFAGTRIWTTFTSLDDLQTQLTQLETEASDDTPTSDLVDAVTVTRNGDEFRFEATLTQLDEALADAGGDDSFDLGIDPSLFLDEFFKIRFVVTMPGEVTNHNADTIDGSTLVWDVPLDGSDLTLSAVSGSGGSGSNLILILVVLAGLLLLGYLGLTVIRRRQESVALYEPPSFSTQHPHDGTSETPVSAADPFSS